MNILLVNKFFWHKGGSETVFFGEKDLLESNGHKVIPFSMHNPQNLPSKYSEHFVSNIDYDTAGKWDKIKAAGRIVFSVEARRHMKALLKQEKIDLAHFHIFQHQISPSVFGPLREAGIPIILTLHDLKPICPNYLMYTQGVTCEKCKGQKFYHCVVNKCTKNSTSKSFINMVEMYFHSLMGYYQQVDQFIAVSQFYRHKMVEFGYPENQLTYIPNFIDTGKFAYTGSDKGYALYFGRLSKEKGIFTLLDACSKCQDIPVIIAGTGPQETELKAKADAIGLQHVDFVGFKSGDALLELLCNASFTILPSEWYENCPMSALESMAVGTPVLGARIGGIPELVEEGVDGYTFESRNSDDLAHNMQRLWTDGATKRKEMGRKGAEKVAARNSRETHYQTLLKTYKNVLESR